MSNFPTLPRFAPLAGFGSWSAVFFALAAFLLVPFTAMSASAAFPATKPGVTELKTLPAGLLVRSEAKGDYFKKNGDLFRPLFRYIQRKDIAMTTPVEAQMGETSAMYFWIATTERAKAETDLPPSAGSSTGAPKEDLPISQSMVDKTSVTVPPVPVSAEPAKTIPEGVVVLTRPERLVVSHGGRGGYSRTHFEEARDATLAWLATRPDLVADGEPYAVYWNSPFVPGFLKRYEVHVPVKPAPSVQP